MKNYKLLTLLSLSLAMSQFAMGMEGDDKGHGQLETTEGEIPGKTGNGQSLVPITPEHSSYLTGFQSKFNTARQSVVDTFNRGRSYVSTNPRTVAAGAGVISLLAASGIFAYMNQEQIAEYFRGVENGDVHLNQQVLEKVEEAMDQAEQN